MAIFGQQYWLNYRRVTVQLIRKPNWKLETEKEQNIMRKPIQFFDFDFDFDFVIWKRSNSPRLPSCLCCRANLRLNSRRGWCDCDAKQDINHHFILDPLMRMLLAFFNRNGPLVRYFLQQKTDSLTANASAKLVASNGSFISHPLYPRNNVKMLELLSLLLTSW